MSNTPKLTLLPYSMRFVGYHVCRLLTFVIYDVCCLMLMMCVVYDVCGLITFVGLLHLSHYDLCRLITFVAYDVCRQL